MMYLVRSDFEINFFKVMVNINLDVHFLTFTFLSSMRNVALPSAFAVMFPKSPACYYVMNTIY
jgi:hypothetical protein